MNFLKSTKSINKYWFLFALFILVTAIIFLSNGIQILSIYESFAKWAYPKNENRNGEVLQLSLNIIAGIAILYGLYVSYRRAKAMEAGVEKQGEALEKQNAQIELTRKAQTDERFKNAVEHLGSDKEPVILGGISELHQIALENKEQYAEVVLNILCSYIRSTAKIKSENINKGIIQTILNYILYSKDIKNNPYLNLNFDLSYTDLSSINLENVDLGEVDFSFSYLPKMHNVTCENCRFTKSIWIFSTIEVVTFTQCDFFLTNINSSEFIKVTYLDCRQLSTFTVIDTRLRFVKFKNSVLNSCVFIACEFENCDYEKSIILDCSFFAIGFKNNKFSQISQSQFISSSFINVECNDLISSSKFNSCLSNDLIFAYNLENVINQYIDKKNDLSGLIIKEEWFQECELKEMSKEYSEDIINQYQTIKSDIEEKVLTTNKK